MEYDSLSSSEIIFKTNDGGFIVISKEIGSNGNYIIKFDQNAEEEWRTHYYSLTLENTITGQLNVIHQRENGNFISGGQFYTSSSTTNFQNIVIEYDSNGNELWTWENGDNNSQNIEDLIPTNDGGFIFVCKLQCY